MTAMRKLVLASALLLLTPAIARADITAFLGISPTPENRGVKGFAVGAGLAIVGFEGEYANTNEDVTLGAPQLRTFMFNGLLQTPFPIAGFQFYGTPRTIAEQVKAYHAAGVGILDMAFAGDAYGRGGTVKALNAFAEVLPQIQAV